MYRRLKIVGVATLTPVLLLGIPTHAHAVSEQSTAFTIIGQEVSFVGWGCAPGIALDSFTGWIGSTPQAGSSLAFKLDLCIAALPSYPGTTSIPVYGYYNPLTSPPDSILGVITLLGPVVSGNICTLRYALDFVGPVFSTTTPDSVGTTVGRWPLGAIRLDYTGFVTLEGFCNIGLGGSVGGQVQTTGSA